jgi:hypothetical protein
LKRKAGAIILTEMYASAPTNIFSGKNMIDDKGKVSGNEDE